MMIKTAGGPGLVAPIDFHERKSPRMSRATVVATAVVVAAHVGVGAALYYQRFEIPVVAEPPAVPIFDVVTVRPKPPEPLVPAETPPAPNPPLNDTPRPLAPTDTVTAVLTDAPTSDSTTLTFLEPVPLAVPDSPAREPVITPAAPVITSPSWSRQPSADQLMAAYPRRALTAGVSGSASLNCLVQPNGAVNDCNVTRETPGGHGFGRAAQGLSRHFSVNPRTVDGAAEGSRVVINLRFTLPDD